MRKLLFLLISASLFAKDVHKENREVRIEAKVFEADEKSRISKFMGDVRIQTGDDEINSSVVNILFNKDNQPKKYEFDKNVSFNIHINNQHYIGRAEKVELDPLKEQYRFVGSVEITELTSNRKIEGREVYLDGKNGKLRIAGDEDKPVIMKFELDK
jgi:lipopolysaccharide transport protein LptA